MSDQPRHSEAVNRWLSDAEKSADADEWVPLFEQAFGAIWERVRPTLSEVTLGAVADRALHHSREKFPLLAAVRILDNGIMFENLKREVKGGGGQVREALRTLLVEFLTIVGALSGEILTPALHDALRRSDHPPAAGAEAESSRGHEIRGSP